MKGSHEDPSLEIKVISSYEWQMDIRIAAVSENFRGSIEVDASPDWLSDLAAKFRGYPESREDRFHAEIGIENYRYVVIEAFCVDSAGHAMLVATMTEDLPCPSGSVPSQEARIAISFEPAAADEFAAALEQIAETRTGRALLVGVR